MIRILIYILLLVEIFIRYIFSSCRNTGRLKILLMSAIIQSLMIYPVIFSYIISIREQGLKEFNAPYENNIALLFPTIIATIIMLISSKKQKWDFKEIRFTFFAICIALIFSYITPYNLSSKATNLVLILFLQIGIVIYISKTYLTSDQIIISLYDGLKVVIIIEFIVSFTYVLGFNTLQGMFFTIDVDEIEWIREGTNIKRAYGTTIQPNRLGGLCAFICIFFYSCYNNKYKKVSSLFYAGIAFIVVVLSQSRSALLAIVTSVAFLSIIDMYKKNLLSIGVIIGMGILGTVLIVGLLNLSVINDMIFKADIEDQEENRLIHYYLGGQILKDTHFMGTGLNSHVYYMYYKLTEGGIWMLTHPIHSVHLTLFVETGMIGFLWWIYFLCSRIVRFIKTPISQMNNPILWMTFAGMLIIVLVHGFTDVLYLHYQYLMLLMLVGAFYHKTT